MVTGLCSSVKGRTLLSYLVKIMSSNSDGLAKRSLSVLIKKERKDTAVNWKMGGGQEKSQPEEMHVD